MSASAWGRFSAEYGFGDAWSGFGRGGTLVDEWGGGGGGSSMSAEATRGLAEYERRLETTREASAAQSALNAGDTNRAAAILASNPEIGIEIGGQRLVGGQAADYLLSQESQTITSTNRRLAQQPPDLSGRGVPQLSQPLGLPTSVTLPPPPPPLPPPPGTASVAGNNVAARSGFDHARQRQADLQNLPLVPLPPGMTPNYDRASQEGVRQIIDTTGINAQSRDLGRQVARQGLLQMGWSGDEADRYLRDDPGLTFRTNYGTGAPMTDAELRQRVASGQVDNQMTAEQYRRLEAWRSEALRRQAATDGDDVVRIETNEREQQARHAEGFGSFMDGLTRGDFSDNDSWSGTGGQIVGGLIPFYGQAADARDTAAALRDVWQGREGAGTNLLLAGVGWIPLVGDGIKNGARVARRAGVAVSSATATNTLRAVPDDVLVNGLRQSFSTQRYQFGQHNFQLDRSGMRHILERHHPNYWNGSMRDNQTFLHSRMSIEEATEAVGEVMRQNRETLVRQGTNGRYQIFGTHNGVSYTVGITNGRVGQFFPSIEQ